MHRCVAVPPRRGYRVRRRGGPPHCDAARRLVPRRTGPRDAARVGGEGDHRRGGGARELGGAVAHVARDVRGGGEGRRGPQRHGAHRRRGNVRRRRHVLVDV